MNVSQRHDVWFQLGPEGQPEDRPFILQAPQDVKGCSEVTGFHTADTEMVFFNICLLSILINKVLTLARGILTKLFGCRTYDVSSIQFMRGIDRRLRVAGHFPTYQPQAAKFTAPIGNLLLQRYIAILTCCGDKVRFCRHPEVFMVAGLAHSNDQRIVSINQMFWPGTMELLLSTGT
jgi:hypothetical protein